MKLNKRFFILIASAAIFLIAIRSVDAASKKYQSLESAIGKIMVFDSIVPAEHDGTIRTCPVCSTSVIGSEVLSSGAHNLDNRLIVELKNFGNCAFVKPADDLVIGAADEKARIDETIKAAKKSSAGAALIPVLLRYSQRVGKGYAASKPAGVAFHLHLFKTADSAEIWDFAYNETQQALSENLLDFGKFIRRRAQWVKADVLLQEGIIAAAKEFPLCEVAPQ